MERSASVFGIDRNGGDDPICHPFDSFHMTVPFPRVLAIGNDEFIDRKMLIGAVPVDNRILMKIASDFAFLLGKDGFPKFFNIHVHHFHSGLGLS